MINQLQENLERFDPITMWKDSFYIRLVDFLDKPKTVSKLFFWVVEENEVNSLSISDINPPSFYGKFIFNLRFSLSIQI